MDLSTPQARESRLGSAKKGTAHWWMQRVTSLFLVPLVLWGAFASAMLGGLDHARFVAWVGNPLSAILLIALLIVICYHTALGLQVIIEDYVHTAYLKIGAIIAVYFVSFMMALVGVVSVIKIAL